MDFAFSEEQEMLRAAAGSWLSDRFPIDRVVQLADGEPGWDPASWAQLVSLGWLDRDLGLLEQAVLAEQTGYALYPGPWWSTVALAGPVLGVVPERPTTLAWAEPGAAGDLRSAARPGPATMADAVGLLTGTKIRVPDLAACESVLVVAAGPDGPGCWQVDVATARVVPTSTTDRTRRLAELHLDGTVGRPVALEHGVDAVLADVRRRAGALLACEAVGVAQRCLTLCTAYAKERTQFGRPIGAYQGVSHRIADIFTALQLARSLAYRAAASVNDGTDDADQAVTVAMISAGDAATLAAENAIQAMGGIGFTWDHPLHRFYKRAQWIASFDGTGRSRRAELAAQLL